jgi:predicted sugar kinase
VLINCEIAFENDGMNHILKYIKKYLYCARKSSFGPKTKALKSSKKFKKKRPPAHFLAKAKDANQLVFFMWPYSYVEYAFVRNEGFLSLFF